MKVNLSKLCYGTEIDPKKTPFNLVNGQIRTNSIINSASWFNSNGERVGKGDLSLADMKKISSSIGDEMFIVLSEADAGWNMPSALDATSPGFEYVISKISWGITGNSIIRVRDYVDRPEKVVKDGIEYTRISRKGFLSLVDAGRTKQAASKPSVDKAMAVNSDVSGPQPAKVATAVKTSMSKGFIGYVKP